MQEFKENFFYLKELSSSSEDFENEYGSFSNPKVVGFPTNMQLRRGSTHYTTEPVTLNKYASAYLNQQHSDPGYNKGALAQRDQQHSDPGYNSNHRMTWLKLCCCFTEEPTQVAPLNEFSINTRLKRQPSFRYHK